MYPYFLYARVPSIITVLCLFVFILFWGHSGNPGVAFVSFAHMESVLNERFFEDGQAFSKLRMNSHVVGGIVTGEKKEDFSKPIVYTLQHIQVCVLSSEMSDCLWRSQSCYPRCSNLFKKQLIVFSNDHRFGCKKCISVFPLLREMLSTLFCVSSVVTYCNL